MVHISLWKENIFYFRFYIVTWLCSQDFYHLKRYWLNIINFCCNLILKLKRILASAKKKLLLYFFKEPNPLAVCMTNYRVLRLFHIPKYTWKKCLKWNSSGGPATCFYKYAEKEEGKQTPVVQNWIVPSVGVLLKMSNITAVSHKCFNTSLPPFLFSFFSEGCWITTRLVSNSVDLPQEKE